MRILVVHPRMSIMGGGERVAIHCITAALNSGHQVGLLSEDFDTKKFEDFFGSYGLFDRLDRLTFPRFKPKIRSGFLLYQRLYYYQEQFRRLLSRLKMFDLILGTQDVGYTPTVRAPIVQYCYFPEYFGHLQSRPTSPIWRLYYRPARIFYRNRVRRIGEFLSVSNYTREFVKETWGRDSLTVYPPCPVQFYSGSSSSKENLVITIGRIVREKRIHLFVDMARMLPSIKFTVIGSVADENSGYVQGLRKEAPPNVSFILSPLRKARDVLARAKVYVHCAENEHFGITIVEAMAAGCVPVVHDSGGPREIVSANVGYRWRSIEEATSQISRVIEDEASREKLSRAAVSRAKLYGPDSFESVIVRVLDAYQNDSRFRSAELGIREA